MFSLMSERACDLERASRRAGGWNWEGEDEGQRQGCAEEG